MGDLLVGRILGILLGILVGGALMAFGAYVPLIPQNIVPDIVPPLTVNQGSPAFVNSQAWPTLQVPSAASSSALQYPCASTFGESFHICKSSPGTLYKWQITTGWIPGWFVVLDSTSAPVPNARISPVKCVYFPINTSFADNWDNIPIPFKNGLTIAFTTGGCFQYVPAPTAFLSADFM